MKTFKVILTDGSEREIDAESHAYEAETLVLYAEGMKGIIAEFQKHYVIGVIAKPLTVTHFL